MPIDKKLMKDQYEVDEAEFSKLGLTWDQLEAIREDHIKRTPQLQLSARQIADTLQAFSAVHSVRWRIKDPDHLVGKIFRKAEEDWEMRQEKGNKGEPVPTPRDLSLGNYASEVADLIGVRVLHLFKTDWEQINKEIRATWELNEKPVAYHRKGDNQDLLDQYKSADLDPKQHKAHYRSLHYVIKTSPTKSLVYAEVQVRTIFEEGWSEVDHLLKYPRSAHPTVIEQLAILNRVSGSADEIATASKALSEELAANEIERARAKTEAARLKVELQKTLDALQISQPEKDDLRTRIQRLEGELEVAHGRIRSQQESASGIHKMPGVSIDRDVLAVYARQTMAVENAISSAAKIFRSKDEAIEVASKVLKLQDEALTTASLVLKPIETALAPNEAIKSTKEKP